VTAISDPHTQSSHAHKHDYLLSYLLRVHTQDTRDVKETLGYEIQTRQRHLVFSLRQDRDLARPKFPLTPCQKSQDFPVNK